MTGAGGPAPDFDPGQHNALPAQRVRWGVGALADIGEELDQLGVRRPLLATTASLAGVPAGPVADAVGPRLVGRSADLAAQVPDDAVERLTHAALVAEADALVSFGGGSVIDGAKAARRRIAERRGGPPPIQIALPTTLSGAEYAHFYGVTRDGLKRSHAEPDLVPSLVILDPQLTLATPSSLWAGSGFKALDHAVEGILGGGGRPICDPLALAGVGTLAERLRASLDPDALTDRLACQIAAWQCYFAPINATLGLSHRIGHILGGTYEVPHSLTSAITLPLVMRAHADGRPDRLEAIGSAIDGAAGTRAADRFEELALALELPVRLREVGVDCGDIPRIAHLVVEHYPAEAATLGGDPVEELIALLMRVA